MDLLLSIESRAFDDGQPDAADAVCDRLCDATRDFELLSPEDAAGLGL